MACSSAAAQTVWRVSIARAVEMHNDQSGLAVNEHHTPIALRSGDILILYLKTNVSRCALPTQSYIFILSLQISRHFKRDDQECWWASVVKEGGGALTSIIKNAFLFVINVYG